MPSRWASYWGGVMREVSAIVASRYIDIMVLEPVPETEPAWLDSPRPLPLPLAAFTALVPCGRRRKPEEPPASVALPSTSCEVLPDPPPSLDEYWLPAVCFVRFEFDPVQDGTSPAHLSRSLTDDHTSTCLKSLLVSSLKTRNAALRMSAPLAPIW